MNPLITILGPTASGKTKLAVLLAQQLDAEIISADSRQVYKKLNIGTGKDLDEYGNIHYHLIDIIDPNHQYNVFQYRQDAEEVLRLLDNKGVQPILCGGTGFYIEAVLSGFNWVHVPPNEEIKRRYNSFTHEELFTKLNTLELPENYRVDKSSKKRLIRAIEIAHYLNNKPKAAVIESTQKKSSIIFGLKLDPENRRKRISDRLYDRLENGLWDEVKGLIESGISPEKLKWFGLEYKYLTMAVEAPNQKEYFIQKLETEIHRYAKRQMTFFRKLERDGYQIHWIDAGISPNKQLECVLERLKGY